MAISTRLATHEDAEGIATAHVRGWQVAYRNIVPDEILDAIVLEERTERWRRMLQRTEVPDGASPPTHYVAEVDGEVIGFADVGVFRADAANDLAGELWAMYVNPEHWSTGAGHALMQETMAHFRRSKIQDGFLWVLEENARARAFYERHGWAVNEVTQTESIGGIGLFERRYSIRCSPQS